MTFTLKLPTPYDPIVTENNSIIIIGANGSGKSKLGAWIEKQDINGTYRIAAQRALTFGDYIQPKSYEQSTNFLRFGNEQETTYQFKWNHGRDMTTTMQNDYDYVLAAFIAKQNKQEACFVEECRERDRKAQSHDKVPSMIIDTFNSIWDNVFPHRKIVFNDLKPVAKYNQDEYTAKGMSDGERQGMYIIAQCLSVPDNKIVIIDEPEIHLHHSIMNKLYTEIEKVRSDCLFVYITHNTEFAASHRQSQKVWAKSFDGTNWELENIEKSELPEDLLLDILGNRKKVIFVEGTTSSYDTKLYSEIYKDYYVVPCGGCSSVIARTKAMKNTPQLHHIQCYGIIDRDYRCDNELTSYVSDNIFSLKVAEVENLFIVEELLKIINEEQGYTDNSRVEDVKNYIIDDRYSAQKSSQVCKAVVSEVKFQLTQVLVPEGDAEARAVLSTIDTVVAYDDIKTEMSDKFDNALVNRDYKKILDVFNQKELPKSVGHYLGLNNHDYCDMVIRKLSNKKDVSDRIKAALKPYLPKDIPLG